MTFAEMTKYPKLYRQSEWGQFEDGADPVIIENRNAIAEHYGLKGYKKIPEICCRENGYYTFSSNDGFNHLEFYKQGASPIDPFVMFTSTDTGQDMSIFGLQRTVPIWTQDLETWCRIFQTYYEYRKFYEGIPETLKQAGRW